MAHTLRYYKEITHADGKVIRVEFHEKDGTAAAMELGDVIQSLNLDLQDDGDIDAPIAKTMLNFTFIDAPDHAEAKTKKCGAWEEFYSPDATHWKVLLFEVVGGEKMPIWGGYITPDSFREVLTYRAGVSFIARDNIGHMQDFPFDAKGNDDGMITLMGVLTSAWAKIESPMRLNFTSSGADWLRCEDTLALDTYMNVSAFEDKNWYEVFEEVLYSYGLVLRFTGNAEVSVFPLRYLPFYGGETTTIVNPVFQTGAERELSPAVKRIEESVEYELDEISQPLVQSSDFSGELINTAWNAYTAPVWALINKNEGKGWSNIDKNKTRYFNARGYQIIDIPSTISTEIAKEEIYDAMWLLCSAKEARAEYSRYIIPNGFITKLKFGKAIYLLGNINSGYSIDPVDDLPIRISYVVTLQHGGITNYLDNEGKWVLNYTELEANDSNGISELVVNIPSFAAEDKVLFSLYITDISTSNSGLNIEYIQVSSLTFSAFENIPICKKNIVNTNFSETNNIILSRNPKIAPALNNSVFPGIIKNGIFRKHGSVYYPAKLWSWNGSGAQQMAVYNHLQLLCYHSKPNNIITGTILNADVANHAKLYRWGGVEHLLISGTLDMLTGYIENATLREFVRYEDMWGDLTDTADFPEVEGSSKTTADSGSSSQTTTYSNTTNVTIGGEGGGTIVLDTFMSDSSTNGVQNRIIKAYVDSSIANLINGAPTTLDTLKEIADAFAESQDVVEALESAIGDKANKNDVFTKEQTYDREHIDGEFEDVDNALAVRALKSEVYTKEQIDGKLTGITTDIDNLESSKASNTKVNAIDERLKIEEGVTNTYAAWWKDLMTYVKVVDGNVVIDTNLLVEGESATRGTGDPSTGGGIDLNALEKYLDEYGYINEDDLREYGFVDEQDVNNAINALNIGDYAKTSEVERLFTALNIGQYAKTSDVNTALGDKVDKVSGKGLSTNDFTTALLNKLNAIAEGAEVNVQSDWNATSGDAFIKNKPTLGTLAAKDNVAWSEVQSKPTFADVATSGSYNDLSDKPTIPTTMAWTEITDKPTFALVATTGKYSDLLGAPALAKVAISGKYSDLSGTPDLSVYALTDDVERLFTALNISQYAKTSELGDLAFVDSLSKSDVGLGNVANETYAGGTAVTLNGFSKAKTTASFYAPTSAGTVGYFLKSQGAGDAPIWSALGALATKDSLTYSDVGVTKDVITDLIGTTTYAAYNANGYLPRTGANLTAPFNLRNSADTQGYDAIMLDASYNTFGSPVMPLRLRSSADIVLNKAGSNYTILDSKNYSSYALPLNGGTIERTDTNSIPLILKSGNTAASALGFAIKNGSGTAYLAYYGGTDWRITKEQWGAEYNLIHSGNIGSYALKTDGSNLMTGGISWGATTSESWNVYNTGDGKGLQILNAVGSGSNVGALGDYGVGLAVSGYYGFCLAYNVSSTKLRFKSSHSSFGADWKTIAFTDSDITGNAAGLKGTDGIVSATAGTSGRLSLNGRIYWNGDADWYSIGSYTETSGVPPFGRYIFYSGHIFKTASGEALRINSSGNILMGTTTDNGSGAKLQVAGNMSVSNEIFMGINKALCFTNTASERVWAIFVDSNDILRIGANAINSIKLDQNTTIEGNLSLKSTSILSFAAAGSINASTSGLEVDAPLKVLGKTTINNNLIVTGDVAVA